MRGTEKMTGSIKNQFFRMEFDEDGSRHFLRTRSGTELFSLRPLYEFALQVKSEEYSGLITSGDCRSQSEFNKNQYRIVYSHAMFQLQVCYSMEETAAVKMLTLTARKDLTVCYAQTEVSKADVPLTRGGEGQPIFLDNAAFISIVFPAALNRIDGTLIRLEQAPFVTLRAGETFDFFRIICGFNTEGTLGESFRQYILEHKKRTPAGLRIYGDWGAHDELAGETELKEELSLKLLEQLKKGREAGYSFDYYLMDAFWFEETGGYRRFREKNWPRGPEFFLEELRKQDLKFGLWFDVNMSHLLLPGEMLEKRGNGAGTCLSFQENTGMLFDGIRSQLKRCGCSMLKLDFAFFECGNGEHTVHAPEHTASKEPAIRNFLKELCVLYEIQPDLLVLGYNGFTVNLDCIRSGDSGDGKYAISPWWCLYLDYLYCGDPRPAEHPSENLADSLIWYTDAMIGKFDRALMPLSAIDDHGTMIGETNTIYYLGRGRFRDSWILNLSRGSRKELLYGDLELLEDEDWRFMKDCGEMFEFVCREQVHTERIGGSPERGEVYGYSSSDGKRGYITLVNPGSAETVFILRKKEWGDSDEILLQKYYQNGNFCDIRELTVGPAQAIRLSARETAVYFWEKQENRSRERTGYLILNGGGCECLRLSGKCRSVAFQLADQDGVPLRLLGGREDPFLVEGPGESVSLERLYQEPIWSGCSWAIYRVMRQSGSSSDFMIRLINSGSTCLHIKWTETESFRQVRGDSES